MQRGQIDKSQNGFKKNMNVLYILMRTDLPSMNAGKAMAQAAHAANKAEAHALKLENSKLLGQWYDWCSQTNQNFGTTIVLGATIGDIDFSLKDSEFGFQTDLYFCDRVIDPTYPYIIDNSEIYKLIDPKIHTSDPIFRYTDDASKIIDTEAPVVAFREETTCAYFFGDKNTIERAGLLSHLELHP